MFDRPTVLVLGAGAGFDIKMPLGDRLAELIANAVNFYLEAGALTKGDARIASALQRLSQPQGGWGHFLIAGRMIADGIRYSRSIDNYVHSHSDKEAVKTVAKMAIVQTILDAEKECHIAIDSKVNPPRFKDEGEAHKSWLSDFFTVLQDGIVEAKNLDRIFDNLTIISFNYDRCVEHYLFHVMQRLYPSKGEGFVTELITSKLKILHPYGVVGNLPWQSRTNAVHFGGGSHDNDLAALSSQIRTYNEEVDDKEKIAQVRAAMASAKRIVFLGFHFHKQNVELLAQQAESPDLTGGVVVYGTQIGRSSADLEMIEHHRMPRILHGRRIMESSNYKTVGRGCKELLRDYGSVLTG
jgi:hypothetical protein